MRKIEMEVVCIERNKETYTIPVLPPDWDEMSEREKYCYISGEGTLVSVHSLFFDIDHVDDVSDEGK